MRNFSKSIALPTTVGPTRPAEGDPTLLAGMFMPEIPHPSFAIEMGSFPRTYANANWFLLAVGDHFGIISAFEQGDVPRLAMTIDGPATVGSSVIAAPWVQGSNQLWWAPPTVSLIWNFVSYINNLAIQVSGPIVKGAALSLGAFDATGHGPGQNWVFPDHA